MARRGGRAVRRHDGRVVALLAMQARLSAANACDDSLRRELEALATDLERDRDEPVSPLRAVRAQIRKQELG